MMYDKVYDKALKANNYEVKVWREPYMNSYHVYGSLDNKEIICIRCSDNEYYSFIKLYNLKVFFKDKNGNYILTRIKENIDEQRT